MLPHLCGSPLLLALPDDIFSVITTALCPREVCSLGLSCRDHNSVVSSDKVWLAQCYKLGLLPCGILIKWRNGVLSYKALYRFLVGIHLLIGIWVNQNSELGNVVYVMPGFLSVVGCRIIPQEVGPLGVEDGPIWWTPVFEILYKYGGSTTFFLHGRERGVDYVYPGWLKSVDRDCNVLLLEVEPRHHQWDGGKRAHNKSFDHEVDKEVSHRMVTQKGTEMSFSHLGFDDRSRLVDVVTSQVGIIIPESANVLLFPLLRNNMVDSQQDFIVLHERRLLLLQMYKHALNPTELGSSEVCKSLNCTNYYHASHACDGDHVIKQILRKSSSTNGDQENQSTLDEFLRSGNRVGLSLRAATMELDSYSDKAWPNMHGSRFILYKLPIGHPNACHEYAGLWGGTFGWPLLEPSEDKPGKPLFLIWISYEESKGQQHMIATKILEGTSCALHPNGSTMFTVDINQQPVEKISWDIDQESNLIGVKESFTGEGIANGYGFRYPGSKSGSLFVLQNGLLVFIWDESRDVLTLQRLDMTDLLTKVERVPSLSPISNFSYLTRTHTNVYSGF